MITHGGGPVDSYSWRGGSTPNAPLHLALSTNAPDFRVSESEPQAAAELAAAHIEVLIAL